MERVIIHFIDEDKHFINIPGTDIFEQNEYLHIYNGKDLVCVVLASSIKVAYKSVKGEVND